MKIALVAQHFPPHFEGGTEVVVRAQGRELLARGHDVRVVSGTDHLRKGPAVLRAEVDGLPVVFLPRTAHEPYDLILERPRIQAHVLEEVRGADVVHVHHWSTLDNALVRGVVRAGPPVVVTLHDLFTTCPRFFRIPVAPVEACPERAAEDDVEPCVLCCAPDARGMGEEVLRAGLRARHSVFRAELEAAGRLLAPSRAHAAHLERLWGLEPGRIEVLPHGLCLPVEPLPAPSAAFRAPGPLRVLHLGNRVEVKGTLDLVRALAALPDAARARVRLVLAGREVQPGFDARLAEEARGLSIEHVGPYDCRALSNEIAERGGAHLAAFPSRAHESYGLVVDEALALGLPVWVSDRGALPERLGGAGRVLPAEDPAAWTAAFAELLADPTPLAAWRAALPERPRTAADAAAELEACYESLVGGNAPSTSLT